MRLAALIASAFVATCCNAQAQDPSFERAWKTGEFETPESVLYVEALDAFLVSNIAGVPTTKEDGDGYVSRLSLDGKIVEKRFVDGLDAPKGMAATEDRLYVSDINDLVEIDMNKRRVVRRYPVEGAEFLNDVTIAPDGRVLVSDMRTGKIHALVNGEMAVWSDDARLIDETGGINGLLAEDERLLALVGDRLYSVDWNDRSFTEVISGVGTGDGLVPDGRGGYVLTQWAGRIFHLSAEGTLSVVSDTRLMGVNTADPGWAPGAGVFAVPTFFDNAVLGFRFKE
ncbi:MAG: hypothetical protein AAF850_08075 [Pseudomonadota bacterium]